MVVPRLLLLGRLAASMRGVNRVISFLGGALRSGSALRRVAPYGTCSPWYEPEWLSEEVVDPYIGRSVRYGWDQDVQGNGSPPAEEGLKPKDVVLFQYVACPLGNKVSAFLDYYEIPYIGVHVTPITKKQVKWSDYKELPIFVVDGQPMVDSSDLINKLVERMHPDYDLNADEEKKWREWVDNYLVHVVLANAYRTFSEALESFDYVAPETLEEFASMKAYLSLSERLERLATMYGGAATMYCASKKLKKKHNITDERAALYGAAEQWVDALKSRKFLGGWNNPNLADLAVFGALRSIRYLKPGKDMVKHTQIQTWYSDMEQAVRQSFRVSSLRAEYLINHAVTKFCES